MSEKKYHAPALVKGLEILELLAPQASPMTLSEMSESLGRSKSQIFRMVQELENMGYIARDQGNDGYTITNKLFMLGLERPHMMTLLEAAMPEMTRFSNETRQSCHIAIRSGARIVVIARRETPGPVSFSVRVGHRQLISRSSSGAVLAAWINPQDREALYADLAAADQDFDPEAFTTLCKTIKRNGYEKRQSRFIKGVTDLAAPILRGSYAGASLTSPCVRRLDRDHASLPVKALTETARVISEKLLPV